MSRPATTHPGRGVRGVVGRWMSALWRRGATESALVLLAAAVASGVVFGAGVARASSQTSDGQTWVARDGSGTVVQINPVTGQAVTEVNVGMPAGPKQVQQGDGIVLVTDPTTGRSVSFDIGRLLVTGSRVDRPGTSKQIYGDGHVYVADLERGVVRAVDPLSLADEGQAYSSGSPLADVVVDAGGTVWALDTDGVMTALQWSDGARRFVDKGTTRVAGAGAGAALVPHTTGVTMFAPGSGAIVQVGTGSDVAATVPGMTGTVLAATTSPQNLTAAAIPDKALAIIVSGTSVYSAHLAADGCDRPGRPAVFAGKVYVPCDGAGRTLVLGPDGRTSGPDIGGGGDTTPVLTQDDDSLVIVTGNGSAAVTVDPQGGTHPADLGDGGVPVVVAATSDAGADATTAAASASGSVPPATAVRTPNAAPDPPARDQPAGPLRGLSSETSPEMAPDAATSHPGRDIRGPDPAGRPDRPGQPTTVEVGRGHGARTVTTSPAGTAACGRHCDRFQPATGVTAVGIGSGAVRVSWSVPHPAPTNYLVQTTDGGALTTADGASDTVVISGLAAGSQVRFVVTADFGVISRVSAASNPVVVPSGSGAGVTTSGPSRPGAPGTGAGPGATSPASPADPSTSPSSTAGSVPGTESSVTTASTASPVTEPSNPAASDPGSSAPAADTSTSTPPSPTSDPGASTTSETSTPPSDPTTNTSPSDPTPDHPAVSKLSVSPGTGVMSAVTVTWTAPTGRAPTSYHVVGTIDASSTTQTADVTGATSTTLRFGAYQMPQSVTVVVTAVYPDGSSDPVSASGETNPATCTLSGGAGLRGPGVAIGRVALPPCIAPPTCVQPSGPRRPTSRYPCQIQAQVRGDAPAGTAGAAVYSIGALPTGHPEAGGAEPAGSPGGRYAAAAGLVALAGLIRLGRYRSGSTDGDIERGDIESGGIESGAGRPRRRRRSGRHR